MGPLPRPSDEVGLTPLGSARGHGERRIIGYVAGAAIVISALGALATTRLLSPHPVPAAFDLVVAVTIATGIACVLIPWDRISPRWLHAIPLCGTIETAIGIKLGRLDPNIADNYYVLVAAFSAYALTSRRAVAFQASLAALASAAPLLDGPARGSETSARAFVVIVMVLVIAGIVTALREGLQRRQRELEDLAVRDPLTGIGNYRLLSERLDYEIARHRRSGHALTVMLLDLDGFKQINDTFGHLVGDRVLIEVARGLCSTLRAQDTLARQGGDEFSILAPGTDDAHAALLATRVRNSLATVMTEAVSTSVGWATFPRDGSEAAALLALADADLRRAKQERREAGDEPERSRPSLIRLVDAPSA
jgi:diguanylate cyclase (GGDEF)-like protein